MIDFKRDGGMSICLSFDEQGLLALNQAIAEVANGETSLLDVTFDRSVVTMKRSSSTEETKMKVVGGDLTTLNFEETNLVWVIEGEDLDCLDSSLSKCQQNGRLDTAELIRVQVPKNKKLDYLYGVLLYGVLIGSEKM